MTKKHRSGRQTISAEELALNKYIIQFKTLETLGTHAIKWGTLGALGYFGATSVEALAGKVTLTEISAFFSWPSSPEWYIVLLGAVFGLGGILYGRKQARLRRDTIERFSQYQQKHESNLDPKRSSSKLTGRGETRPEDL